MKMIGFSTETHVKISSPELSKADFQFVPPKGAVMKDSLFGGILSGFGFHPYLQEPQNE